MLKNVFQLIIGFISGYLYIKWVPIQHPFHLHNFFMEFVFHPLEFFSASVSFIVGFITMGELIFRNIIVALKEFLKSGNLKMELLFGFFLMLIGLSLYQMGPIHTVILFSISFFYGMISIKN